jgi:hypothetical protein
MIPIVLSDPATALDDSGANLGSRISSNSSQMRLLYR